MSFAFFGKKISRYLQEPQYAFVLVASTDSPHRYVIAQEGAIKDNFFVKFYMLVDEKTGIIEKMSYQIFAPVLSVAICEVVCELAILKNYIQVSRIGADLVEKSLKDSDYEELPENFSFLVNQVLSALYLATDQCQDIVLEGLNYQSPLFESTGDDQNHEPFWSNYSYEEKLSIIKEVIKKDIEPYVALDEGGVEVKAFINDSEVVIGYKGSCTTCFSATGATLNAISHILKQKVHKKLIVKPDISTLKF